ncbi:MAG: hypothetical protein M3Z85_20375, partial [Acidobacteriota bacterium]|nr:hypothetical protein [Acidobacteriota bacterium]
FVSLWATYRIGEKIFSRRVGIWSAILLACYSNYHLCTTEFRTDDLWAALWLLGLLVLVSGPFEIQRALVSGLLLGLCFAVSMKTTLMFLTIVTATVMAASVIGWSKLGLHGREVAKSVAAFLGAMAIVPAIIFAFFAAKGIWPQMRYCVFEHNFVAHRPSMRTPLHLLILPVALPLLVYGVRKVFRNRSRAPAAFRQFFLLFAAGAYVLLLHGLWGHITRQDYLPFYPLIALMAGAALCAIPSFRLANRIPAPALAAILIMAFSLGRHIPRTNGAAREIRIVREVLRISKPDDYVFDRKGEAVFRRRPVYYVLEVLTRERINRHLMVDDLVQRCVETRTCVVVTGAHFLVPDQHFIDANYLPGPERVRVAGYFLHPPAGEEETEFNVAIPADYVVIAPEGNVTGMLDGIPYEHARFLAAGKHRFRLTSPAQRLAIVWAPAVERNFSPFSRRHEPPHT